MKLPYEICGFVGGEPMYLIRIKLAAWHRIVQLSGAGIEGLPNWLDRGNGVALGTKMIATTDPEYFNPKKESTNVNYTKTDQKGFNDL